MENSINIGELDTLIDVIAGGTQTGSMGETIYSYSDWGAVWAKVVGDTEDLAENENFSSSKIMKVTMYKMPDMTTLWRLKIDSVTYEIISIDMVSRFSPLCIVTVKAL